MNLIDRPAIPAASKLSARDEELLSHPSLQSLPSMRGAAFNASFPAPSFLIHPVTLFFTTPSNGEVHYLDFTYGRTRAQPAWILYLFITSFVVFPAVTVTEAIVGDPFWSVLTSALSILSSLVLFALLFVPCYMRRKTLFELLLIVYFTFNGIRLAWHDIEFIGIKTSYYGPLRVAGIVVEFAFFIIARPRWIAAVVSLILLSVFSISYAFAQGAVRTGSISTRLIPFTVNRLLETAIILILVRLLNYSERLWFRANEQLKEKNREASEVAERTRRLLENILPEEFVDKVPRMEKGCFVEEVSNGCLLETDLVSFSKWVESLSKRGQEGSEAVYRVLNSYWCAFDAICGIVEGLDKIHTVGDAYWVFSTGREEEDENGNDDVSHLRKCVRLAIAFVLSTRLADEHCRAHHYFDTITDTEAEAEGLSTSSLQLRVGIAGGPCFLCLKGSLEEGKKNSSSFSGLSFDAFGDRCLEVVAIEQQVPSSSIGVNRMVFEATRNSFRYGEFVPRQIQDYGNDEEESKMSRWAPVGVLGCFFDREKDPEMEDDEGKGCSTEERLLRHLVRRRSDDEEEEEREEEIERIMRLVTCAKDALGELSDPSYTRSRHNGSDESRRGGGVVTIAESMHDSSCEQVVRTSFCRRFLQKFSLRNTITEDCMWWSCTFRSLKKEADYRSSLYASRWKASMFVFFWPLLGNVITLVIYLSSSYIADLYTSSINPFIIVLYLSFAFDLIATILLIILSSHTPPNLFSALVILHLLIFQLLVGLLPFYAPYPHSVGLATMVNHYVFLTIEPTMPVVLKFVLSGLDPVFVLLGVSWRGFDEDFFLDTLILTLGTLYAVLWGLFLKERTDRRAYSLQGLLKNRKETIESDRRRNEALVLSVLPKDIVEAYTVAEDRSFVETRDSFLCFVKIHSSASLTSETIRPFMSHLASLHSAFNTSILQYGDDRLIPVKTFHESFIFVTRETSYGEFEVAVEGARLCVEACNLQVEKMKNESQDWVDDDNESSPPWYITIGLACGQFNCGVFGHSRWHYDVLGSTVNLSARLCHEVAQVDEIAVSDENLEGIVALDDASIEIRSRGSFYLKGIGTLECSVIGLSQKSSFEQECQERQE